MATRKGPVPKRSDARHGHRTKAETASVDTTSAARGVTWPAPDEEWHPVAQDWFRALGESGQAVFFEPSDLATARYVATAMSNNLASEKFSSMLFAAVMSASGDLLATEGARRRLRVELERAQEEDPAQKAAVSNLAAARARMEKRTG